MPQFPDTRPAPRVPPPVSRKRRPVPRPPRYGRRRALVLVPVVISLLVGWSLIGALATPGNENFQAKWADWLRAHHAGSIVNPVERWYYDRQAPPTGGHPKGLNATPKVSGTASAPPAATALHGHLPPPGPVPLVVTPAVAGEGAWTPTGPTVDGAPGMYVAQFRADTTFTSQITSAVWIDPTRLKVRLVPGAREPGGKWTETPYLGGPDEARAVAAFNGGSGSRMPRAASTPRAEQPSRSATAPHRWSSTRTEPSTSGRGVVTCA